MAQQQGQPLFDDIEHGDLEAVQQHVREDAAVLEERRGAFRTTVLMVAIYGYKPAIALWLIQHRCQHNLDTADDDAWTALHHSSSDGLLQVVQALVEAGANPAAFNQGDETPLIWASNHGNTDIVAFLLRLPTVKTSINHIDQNQDTALSCASYNGYQPIVQLLLDVDADPTIPGGQRSPLNRAVSNDQHTIAALLRPIIAEADRFRKCVAAVGKGGGLSEDLCSDILKYLLPAWATKEPHV